MQWTPTEKTAPVKVVTKDGMIAWQGTYCYGIAGDIIYRQPYTMEAYTEMLEKWKQEIIENVKILVPLDILSTFMKQGKYLIATDGSAGDDTMSFVWKVVDVDGNAYFCHANSAFRKESSFRTEAYGILLVLCFLHQWMEHNMFENKIYTTVYLDNEGVIDRIAKQQTYPFDYSFHTIDPDWDIIAQICNMLEIKNIKAEFKHVNVMTK
eukprot:11532774-Ditylum_brightwellii.AAC.1